MLLTLRNPAILHKLRIVSSSVMMNQTASHHVDKKLHNFPAQAFINGHWVDAASSSKFKVVDPASNELLGEVANCDASDVNKAVNAAHAAFDGWRNQTADQRSKILRKMFDLHMEHKQQLAEILTRENGKPLREALVEIEASAKSYEWFSEEAKRTYGDIIPSPASNKRFLVVKQPVGVCGFITPWNFPASMIARKAGAALAAGCTIVIKPSEDTPYSALALCQIGEMAGLPAGVLNVVPASREHTPDVGKALCQHDLVKKISFTGSTPVGKILLAQSASTVKRTQMELGGNAPFIVFDSADIDRAITGLLVAKFRNAGQTCICANRILVQEGIHDKFVEALAKAMREQLVVGHGLDAKSTQGPLINRRALEKVKRLVDESKAQGARVVLGGNVCNILGGNFYEPTLVSGVKPEMELSREEIFGPVAAIIKFKTEEEAVRIANAADVGLAGYFYSNDPSQIWRVAEKLEVGMVGANESVISTIEAPFGGIKQSGYGHEGSKYGIEEYMHKKYICMGL